MKVNTVAESTPEGSPPRTRYRIAAAFELYGIEKLIMRGIAEALICPLQTEYVRHKSARDHVSEAFHHSEVKCRT